MSLTKLDNNCVRNIQLLIHEDTYFITPKNIKKKIEEKLSITNLGTKTRKRPYPYLRHVYFKLCKQLTDVSLDEMAQICGERDHSTALHSIKKFDEFNGQKFFDDYVGLYNIVSKELISELKFKIDSEKEETITINDIKIQHEEKVKVLEDKYRTVILKQSRIIHNFRNHPLINDIASLDKEALDELRIYLDSFLLRNSRKR